MGSSSPSPLSKDVRLVRLTRASRLWWGCITSSSMLLVCVRVAEVSNASPYWSMDGAAKHRHSKFLNDHPLLFRGGGSAEVASSVRCTLLWSADACLAFASRSTDAIIGYEALPSRSTEAIRPAGKPFESTILLLYFSVLSSIQPQSSSTLPFAECVYKLPDLITPPSAAQSISIAGWASTTNTSREYPASRLSAVKENPPRMSQNCTTNR
mmetsp:Transcript_64218/g.151181  ORF Transcript_64218/g.151181 Transcript_64218/m.151181 type:complete len:211 (-) Transcript_64218:98-730(-)